jgi:hypothetical protein
MIIPTGTKLPPTDWDAVVAEIVAAQPLLIRSLPTEWTGAEATIELTFSELGSEVQHITQLIGGQVIDEAIDATTDHAWLVVLGYFAQALALIAELEAVPLAQRPGSDCGPQTKLIEFLVGILGGIEYLQDLNKAAQPIATDATVSAAWAQDTFVHYSGVSRTLKAAAEDTLAAVVAVLQAVSRPYLDAAVLETLRAEGQLIVDVDLTGREVSATSTDYPDASFGWMDGDTSKGYQAAVTSLVCARWTRLLLTLQRYTGRTQSAACLQAAVQAVEQLLGVRPRRRVELVQERRDRLDTRIQQLHTKLARLQQAEDALWQRLRAVRTAIPDQQDEVAAWEAVYQAQERAEKRHCRLAKARRKLTTLQQREQRAWRDLKKLHHQRDQYQRQLRAWQDELLALDEWLDYLETDNRSNFNPVTIVLRIDAGFSTGPNLTWLIEMGYIVLTKAHHGSTAHSLRQQVEPQTTWTRVGGNAEAVFTGDYQHHDCPYPLQAMLVRYHLPEKIRYTTLFYYAETPPPPLPVWFAQYNGRQTIEAGIKEGKAVFTLKRHLVRSPIGMQLQEQFALFGANFVRWAAAWVKDLLRQAPHDFITALGQVKTLVCTVSHARARWVRNALGHTLIFDERGPFAGTVISLSGQVAVQLALPLFSFALF